MARRDISRITDSVNCAVRALRKLFAVMAVGMKVSSHERALLHEA
jgi:hypothetical protein